MLADAAPAVIQERETKERSQTVLNQIYRHIPTCELMQGLLKGRKTLPKVNYSKNY